MTTITGRLFLHSETGTEGGYWCIWDEAFITAVEPTDPIIKICSTCHRYWDTSKTTDEPGPSFTYYKPDWEENGTKYLGGYHSSPIPVEGGQTWFGNEEPGSFNDKWTQRGNAESQKCYDDGHTWEWQPTSTEKWDWQGMKYIKDGDVLEVLDPDTGDVVETITVKLIQQPDQYAQDAVTAGGMIIHAYPEADSVNFDQWVKYFSKGYSARLTPAP